MARAFTGNGALGLFLVILNEMAIVLSRNPEPTVVAEIKVNTVDKVGPPRIGRTPFIHIISSTV